jgi:hypothetical protein
MLVMYKARKMNNVCNMLALSWVWRRVILYLDANVSEKHAFSLFRAEVTKWVSLYHAWNWTTKFY